MRLYQLAILFIFFTYVCPAQHKTLHDFSAKTIDGEEFSFSQLKGEKVMIVNTASRCSLAPQLNKLQAVYKEYKGKGFTIVAFPSDDFNNREPGSDKEIKSTYRTKYNITFHIMGKTHVKGDSIHPVYRWLASKEENRVKSYNVMWNFHKFLINEKGSIDDALIPITGPYNKKIIDWILSQD